MKLLRPSIAKILSVPALWWVIVYVQAVLTELIFPNSSDAPPGVWFYTFILFVAYILSCLIWEFGKNHRRILIGVITLLSSFTGFLYANIGITFFCPPSLTNLGLPCGGDYGPCPVQEGCPSELMILSFILPIIILIIGLVLFIREVKKNKKNGKKMN